MNRKPKKQTERGDVAHVIRFLEERGDVARQIGAHLAKETDYQERLRRPITGGLEVVFVRGDVTEAPWITPYGQIVLPKSREEKRQAWRQWEDSMRDGETRPKKASAWVARTIACAEEAGGSDDKRTLFWILALECVERFDLWLREWREGLERFSALENEHPAVDPRYAPTVRAHDAALALRLPLNDWDRLVLTYFRHHAGHFAPTVFDLTNERVIAGRAVRPSDEELRLLRNLDERDEAVRLAGKLLPGLRTLLSALNHPDFRA